MATDEVFSADSARLPFTRTVTSICPRTARTPYNIYRYEKTKRGCILLFPDHRLSDLIAFSFRNARADASQYLIRQHQGSAQPLLDKGKDACVSIILDARTPGNYSRNRARISRRFYGRSATDSRVEPVTSPGHRGPRRIRFRQLHRLVPGSWIDANFNVGWRSGRQSRLGLRRSA